MAKKLAAIHTGQKPSLFPLHPPFFKDLSMKTFALAMLLGFFSTLSLAQTCVTSAEYLKNAERIANERRQSFREMENKLNTWEAESGLSRGEAVQAFMMFSTPDFVEESEKQEAVIEEVKKLRDRLNEKNSQKDCAELMRLEQEDLRIGMAKMRSMVEQFIASRATKK